jgi:FkbM family methyltransferase
MLGSIARFFIEKLGISERLALVCMHSSFALGRLATRGIPVCSVIDIGASNGTWSRDAMRHFPDAKYLLIEAQEVHRKALEEFVRRHANAAYVLKAAGEHPGTIYFNADAPFAGQAAAISRPGLISVPATSIDAEIEARGLRGPYLVKFDVHGFELPILRGATRAVAEASLIVMECYNFKIAPDAMLFADACRYFEGIGFRVADISEPLWRPGDDMFWQIDIFFVKADRFEFRSDVYF